MRHIAVLNDDDQRPRRLAMNRIAVVLRAKCAVVAIKAGSPLLLGDGLELMTHSTVNKLSRITINAAASIGEYHPAKFDHFSALDSGFRAT